MTPLTNLKESKCVVCGTGSHRADWAGQAYPSCDHHTPAEVEAALQKKGLAGGIGSRRVAVPGQAGKRITVPSVGGTSAAPVESAKPSIKIPPQEAKTSDKPPAPAAPQAKASEPKPKL